MSTPGWTVTPDTEAPARKTGLGWWARRMLTAIDTGLGTDHARITVSGTGFLSTGLGTDLARIKPATTAIDTGLGHDHALPAATVTATDTGIGTDLTGIVARILAADTGIGDDQAARAAWVPAPATGIGADTATLRLVTALQAADTGIGDDTITALPVPRPDTGLGTDTARPGIHFGDTGIGTDLAASTQRPRVPAFDTGIGTDTVAPRTHITAWTSATGGLATFEADDAPSREWLHGFSGVENVSREANADWAYQGRGAIVAGWAPPGTFPGITTPRYPAAPGQQVSLAAQITAGPGNLNKHVSGLIRFFDAAGNWITQAQWTENNDASWRPLYMRATCPAGTAAIDYAIIMGLAGEYGASDYFAADNIAACIAANPLAGLGNDTATAGFKQFAPVTTPYLGSGQAGTTFTYNIPWWANIIDLIAVGAGGGGQGGALLSVGTGGTAGTYASRRLVRGVDIPWTTTQITGTVGRGGNGSGYNVFGSSKGDDGQDTVITGWVTAAKGVGRTSPSSASAGLSPGNHTFQGVTVTGGAQVGTGATGNAPGGGGGGGNNAASGGPGAGGGAWCTAHQ